MLRRREIIFVQKFAPIEIQHSGHKPSVPCLATSRPRCALPLSVPDCLTQEGTPPPPAVSSKLRLLTVIPSRFFEIFEYL
ncbi:hypothetical protein L1987_85727 [Smallanthus sonchifolius]|uniref:Uncharacterized protein n=1 Tax=Smallanthus sonchifolius TaxID=185202 RepID=A0ACB8XWU3_9ASTR|nr:hypothetical protein L1987_85727 [Smallanthus sonchifolius]